MKNFIKENKNRIIPMNYMNDNEKKKLKEYIDELRDEMNYWTISFEANEALENILIKMEKLIEK